MGGLCRQCGCQPLNGIDNKFDKFLHIWDIQISTFNVSNIIIVSSTKSSCSAELCVYFYDNMNLIRIQLVFTRMAQF